ncbi:Selenide,water dikinase [Mariniradius saccharolyticus AK6]|uniref:Selenide, water dikinase n=1 Tax=Mariniradius saccharolyticus AK6 TaxID=1239962 RepID=M7X7W5_9BACT|nr:selenide, water dikinase SelD [Mariniradius saccharolyticus]EMS31089.1 Selenide,water dikinase [Mariniradius saccharolyticus AK6]
METPTIRLTQFSEGSGCGCKIAPAVLDSILGNRKSVDLEDPNLLVGNSTKDDAAVYQISETIAMINTVDFFTPIVDDPYDFGRIAAANALSDVYAMGGKPLFANAILSWPVEKIDPMLAAEVLEGGRAICQEAGIPLAGGHSIAAKDPIFGLSVNGIIHPKSIKTNKGSKEGDLIYITKPLGIGVLATALKRDKINQDDYVKMIHFATQINSIGSEFGQLEYIHAMTDVTGFGLLGHLVEMSEGAGLSAVIQGSSLPLIDGVSDYISQFIFPDNTYRNWNAYSGKTEGINGMELVKFCDPQTNGGLMVAVDPKSQKAFESFLEKHRQKAWLIGEFIAQSAKVVKVV